MSQEKFGVGGGGLKEVYYGIFASREWDAMLLDFSRLCTLWLQLGEARLIIVPLWVVTCNRSHLILTVLI